MKEAIFDSHYGLSVCINDSDVLQSFGVSITDQKVNNDIRRAARLAVCVKKLCCYNRILTEPW